MLVLQYQQSLPPIYAAYESKVEKILQNDLLALCQMSTLLFFTYK